MGLGPRSLWLSVALSALYGAMYLVLLGTGDILLAGAALAFVALAAAMWITRGDLAGKLGADWPRRKPSRTESV